jgi:hypothetical protein
MSIFSAKNAKRAAAQTQQLLADAQNKAFLELDRANAESGGYLNRNFDVYKTGYTDAGNAVNQGYDAAAPLLQQAAGRLQPYSEFGAETLSAFRDALGLNGADGSARSTAALRATPGYQFTLKQGLEAVNRSAAARGMAASGNTSAELARYATGLADQTANSYIDRLQAGAAQGQEAANSLAALDKAGADNAANRGLALSALAMQNAGNVASVNDSFAGLGQNTAQSKADMLMNVAGKKAEAVQAAANAADQANANRFSALLGGLKLGAGLFGLI